MSGENIRLEDDLTVGRNTYFIQTNDRSINSAEFMRLLKQDALMNGQMDIFPDGYIPTKESAILDVACGPGGYLREVFQDVEHCYPEIADDITLIGIDNNKKVVEYARNHEQTADHSNVSFELANILDPLDFPDKTFDFVNIRFVTGVLSTNEQEWITLIRECNRVLKPGGFFRITESEMSWVAHAPTNNRFLTALMKVMWTAGKSFGSGQLAITPIIGGFFEAGGFEAIRQALIPINYSYGASAHEAVVEDTLMVMQVTRGALVTIGGIPEQEFDTLFAQMKEEMEGEQYKATWPIVITEGRRPL